MPPSWTPPTSAERGNLLFVMIAPERIVEGKYTYQIERTDITAFEAAAIRFMTHAVKPQYSRQRI